MATYRPLPKEQFDAALTALKADRAQYEPDELERARKRSDEFLNGRMNGSQREERELVTFDI